MSKKPKARGSQKKTGGASGEKTQSERFIEAARSVGVDETGREFDRALKRLVPPRKASRKK